MKKLVFSSILVVSLFALSASAAKMAGVISDEKCAAKHADASEKSQECVDKCIKGGAAPVFVSQKDNKVYKIADASKSKVEGHYGHRVTVNGKTEGDTLTIDSLTMQKAKSDKKKS